MGPPERVISGVRRLARGERRVISCRRDRSERARGAIWGAHYANLAFGAYKQSPIPRFTGQAISVERR